MKPSERIAQLMRELAKKDAIDTSPYANWEQLEDLEQLKLIANMEGYAVMALFTYLDEQAEK